MPAAFPEIKKLATVREPRLLNAPPLPVVFAPETVAPEMARLPPEAMLKILKLRDEFPLLPLMMSEVAPCPVIVRVPAPVEEAMIGQADYRVFVQAPFANSEGANTISSLTLVALASVIACLNEPTPVSALVVTVCCTSIRLALALQGALAISKFETSTEKGMSDF